MPTVTQSQRILLFTCIFIAALTSFRIATSADRPITRYAAAAGVIKDKLYIVGGATKGGAVNTLQAYDPAADTWTSLKPMPTSRFYPAAGVINDKLYVVGGRNDKLGIVDTLEVYDPVNDVWTTQAPMPVQRMEIAAGVIDGKLYVVGGQTRGVALSRLDVYDPQTDKWTELPHMPTARWDIAAAVVKGKLYVIGGRDGTTYYKKIEVFDPDTKSWNTLRGMPTTRAYLAAAVLDDKIYALGGSDSYPCVLSIVEVYDPASDIWSAAPPMPTSRDALVAGVIKGRIYTSSGSTFGRQIGSGVEPLNMIETYIPGKRWETSSGGQSGVDCKPRPTPRPIVKTTRGGRVTSTPTSSHGHCTPDLSGSGTATVLIINQHWDNLKVEVRYGNCANAEDNAPYKGGVFNLPRGGTLTVETPGLNVFYRRANDPDNPNSPMQSIWSEQAVSGLGYKYPVEP